ncbi:hypothetical protein [Pseudoduganella namucuonensis]|uniref:Uncharacterized protein n=1 Tax=Pseudoduganella namucuonensis TaxID=1035707 RepID=A0A1I7JN51_9BURK|nr:hypothetical protein [Pseudoduganella namucuonensis]SFU86601.1 hypothetical protein SAMN05216552_101278 [Pseudoduganella namucuonensis]
MRKMWIPVAMATLSLTGCAVTEPAADQAPQAEQAKSEGGRADRKFDYEPVTGSRLPPKKTHERLVKTIGNQEFREANQVQSAGNILNGRGQ